ncbi:MAG: 30S ribosomal protein S20 [Candidatus Omnitrophica bacterium]|nr:30S ribosomal protein S20 [Candidatus Omnitrophota bacterium]
MPIKRAAYKELRKAKKRHFANIAARSELKTLTKTFESLLSNKKTDEAKKALSELVSKIDRAASKGVIKKNSVSRKISRLMKKLSSGPKT